jgi:hypothetical protein
LEDVSNSSEMNVQNMLQNKAFKIRCYSRKTAKETEKEDDIGISKLVKFKPSLYELKDIKMTLSANKVNTNM